MAKRKKSRINLIPSLDLDPEIKKGIFIIFILSFGALSVFGLFNLAGIAGSYLEHFYRIVFGWGKWFMPFAVLFFGFVMYNEERYEIRGINYLGSFLFLLFFLSLLEMFVPMNEWRAAIEQGRGGGYIGLFMAENLVKLADFWGAFVIILSTLVISLMLMFKTPLVGLFGPESFIAKLLFPITWIIGKIRGNDEEEEEGEEEEEEEEENNDEEEGDDEEKEEEEEEENEEEENNDEEEENEEDEDDEAEKDKFVNKKIKEPKNKLKLEDQTWWSEPIGIRADLPFSLLEDKKGKASGGDTKEREETIRRTLEKFGISVEMGDYTVGPTVTQYTFKPAEGVNLSRILNLSNNLALALAAHPIRIEAPIPGKSLVGIEVPNQQKANVGMKEILKNENFSDRKTDTLLALGKDVAGKGWLYDMTKMPHVLVAGATNSGKSVCINALIVSLLYQNSPDDLRIVLVDPKRVEMTSYEGLPHLLCPIITDAAKTINALRWCINEMEARFEILAKHRKRNIQAYNEEASVKIPYIVFIIDELNDLMMQAGKDLESCIVRLAQKGRASGIHLILATQRPTVQVITGLIKANMPARIAFSVASIIDSRTILDSPGAEKLLGKGDMLLLTTDMPKPVRLQGAFVGDDETSKIVKFIRKKFNNKTYYVDSVTDKQKGGGANGGSGGGDSDDELFDEAKDLVIENGKAATSFLQRKLSVGYGRAAKLLDMLEEAGVVGPANGSKAREVLISQEEYANMGAQGVSGMPLHRREEMEAPESFLGEDEEEEENEEDNESEDEDPSTSSGQGDEEDEEENGEEEESEDENNEEEGEEDDEEEEEESDDKDDHEEEDEDSNNEEEEEEKPQRNKRPWEDRLFSK